MFIQDLLEGPDKGVFEHIVILCRTAKYNKAYEDCARIMSDPEIYIVNPGLRLNDYICTFSSNF